MIIFRAEAGFGVEFLVSWRSPSGFGKVEGIEVWFSWSDWWVLWIVGESDWILFVWLGWLGEWCFQGGLNLVLLVAKRECFLKCHF